MMTAELVCRADDPQWLAERRKGVTATDIPAILGLSQWDSLYSCYWRKVGGYADPADNARLRLGRALEFHIVELWRESHIVSFDNIIDGGLWRNAGRPWQMATPDRCLVGDYSPEPVECKSWGTTDGWGPDGSDVMPVQVRAQVLWQMDVLGAAAGHAGVVFLPSGEFRSYRLEHQHAGGCMLSADHLMIEPGSCQVCDDQVMMRDAGENFWRRVILLDPPSPDGSAASLAALKARFGNPDKSEAVKIPYGLRSAWEYYREEEKRYAGSRREAEAHMRDLAGDAGVYTDDDGRPFARRERFTAHVKAHDRTIDRLMPVKPRKDESDA